MRALLLVISLFLLAGCTTTSSGPRVWYDRKYNEYRYLTGHVPPIRGAQAAAAAGINEQAVRMQQQMDKIRQTGDPVERQKLMREHMQTMQEYAQTKGEVHGCPMIGMMNGEQMPHGPLMAPSAPR